MISEKSGYSQAFVWIWLPGATEPVVAGKLAAYGDALVFNYGRSFLERRNAISIYEAELPLKAGALPLLPGLSMPGCIRDAAPDAWGRRVLLNKKLGLIGNRPQADVGTSVSEPFCFRRSGGWLCRTCKDGQRRSD